jgi:transposase-like protein
MSLKKSHKSYPQVFKDEAVLMVLEQGYSVADAAKSLGVSTSLLYNWKEKYQALMWSSKTVHKQGGVLCSHFGSRWRHIIVITMTTFCIVVL